MGKNCGRTAQGKREAAGQQFSVQHQFFRQTIEDQVQIDFTNHAYVQCRHESPLLPLGNRLPLEQRQVMPPAAWPSIDIDIPTEPDNQSFLSKLTFIWRVCLREGLHTRVTSIPACFRTFRSGLGAPRSVMTSCTADVATIRERLRSPNLLESQTATVRLATSTITRFTLASRRLGVLSPKCASKPSTPRKRRSALRRRSVSSAMGPTSEKEFWRSVPPVRM